MKKIPLTQNKETVVSVEDYAAHSCHKWHYRNGYAARDEGKKCIYLHAVINQTPDGLETDHINGDTLDNRRENLRTVTRSQNNMNAKPRKNCSSRHKGVSWQGNMDKWSAYINKDGQRFNLGYYYSEDVAAIAYNIEAMTLFGSYARINQI